MSEIVKDEDGLKRFLVTAAEAYTNDAVAEETQTDGSLIGIVTEDPYEMADTYHTATGESGVLFNGREVVYQNGHPLWAAGYHAVIPLVELKNIVLDFYYQKVMGNPSPELPIFGQQGIEDDTFAYTYSDVLGGRLTIARFAVIETIQHKATGKNVFQGLTNGGWIA